MTVSTTPVKRRPTAKGAAGPSKKRRKPNARSAPRRVIIAGRRAVRSKLAPVLADLGYVVDLADDARAAAARLDPATVAVVIGADPGGASAAVDVQTVLAAAPTASLPVFVLVPPKCSERHVKRMYAVGATAVAEWPREALTFSRLFRDLVRIQRSAGRPSEADRALERSIQTRLRLAFDGDRVRARVRAGTVSLEGSVSRLDDKRAAERMLAEVPGVQSISTDGVVVDGDRKSDPQLARDARAVLARASSIDDGTLSVAARDGHIVLTGTVAERGELERAIELLHALRGARGLTNLTTISPAQKKVDRSLRRRAQLAVVGLLPPEASVDVKVFGPVAVLSGEVPVLRYKREAQGIVNRKLPVDRIVNKIRVGPARPRRSPVA